MITVAISVHFHVFSTQTYQLTYLQPCQNLTDDTFDQIASCLQDVILLFQKKRWEIVKVGVELGSRLEEDRPLAKLKLRRSP